MLRYKQLTITLEDRSSTMQPAIMLIPIYKLSLEVLGSC